MENVYKIYKRHSRNGCVFFKKSVLARAEIHDQLGDGVIVFGELDEVVFDALAARQGETEEKK